MTDLIRRGFHLGAFNASVAQSTVTNVALNERWQQGLPVLLAKAIEPALPAYRQSITHSEQLYQHILQAKPVDELLDADYYASRWSDQFESLGSGVNQGDAQEMETVYFDAIQDDEIVAEDLWLKVSRLSFHPDDQSMRFRFSFGEDFIQDVAADTVRQDYAAQLSDAVFPESTLITANNNIENLLTDVTGISDIRFVERIIYFNAPNGGAYMHHDLERGHAGVVYAQLTGQTVWIACPRHQLVSEIAAFVSQCHHHQQWPKTINLPSQNTLLDLVRHPPDLIDALESFNHDAVIHLINETKEFIQHMISREYGYQLSPGDVILLPQTQAETCCWHTVFCFGEKAGQALSFAIR